MIMHTHIMYVTPVMAQGWLDKNHINRTLRTTHVEHFRKMYERGEWLLTHQGIALAPDGTLLDGQHRLTFISKLPTEANVPMNVSFDCDHASYIAIDRGAARNPADVLGIPTAMSAAAALFASIHLRVGKGALSVQQIEPYTRWMQPEYDELMRYCSYQKKIWGSSGIRCAAIYQMKASKDKDFVMLSYASLHKADFDIMPIGARALMQQFINGKLGPIRQSTDLFCRAVRAFDPKNKSKRITIRDTDAILDNVRAFMGKTA
jgi:hypothetical protein